LLWLSMAAIALVALFVCAAALLATVEFVYRHLIAAPIAWLLTRLDGLNEGGNLGREQPGDLGWRR
jgi:hypothetical protein